MRKGATKYNAIPDPRNVSPKRNAAISSLETKNNPAIHAIITDAYVENVE